MMQNSNRLLSLDVMRGLIMILLAAESCHLYIVLDEWHVPLAQQFFHHPWHGLRFWDLVQPAFMTMAGAAMFISYYSKTNKGITWQQNFSHIAIRSLKLFICGVALHCVYAGKLVFELWNVLTQLSVTTIIAYLVIRKSYLFQFLFSIALLIFTEILYRFILIPGFDQPFVEHHNFGAWMDTVLMGEINSDGWVAINIIPTAAHTIWGVMAGKALIAATESTRKIKILLLWGTLGVVAGHAIDLASLTPIIKRISTSSFTLAAGGWVLLILAFLYWLTDVKKINKYAWLFVVVGMNAIFIYLFFETVGVQWLNPTVHIFVPNDLLSAMVTLILKWALCYWLYKQKIFFKL